MLIVVNHKKLRESKYGLFNHKLYYIRIGLNKEANDILVMIFNDKRFLKDTIMQLDFSFETK